MAFTRKRSLPWSEGRVESQQRVLDSVLGQHVGLADGLAAYRAHMADEPQDQTPLRRQIQTICGRTLEDVEVVLDHLEQHAPPHITPREADQLKAAGLDGNDTRSALAMHMFEELMVQAAMSRWNAQDNTVYDDWARALQARYPAQASATLLHMEFLNRLVQAVRWDDNPAVEELLARTWPGAASQYVGPAERKLFEDIDERRRREQPLVCLALAWKLSKTDPAGSQEALDVLRVELEALGPVRAHDAHVDMMEDFTVQVRRAALESHVSCNDARPRERRQL